MGEDEPESPLTHIDNLLVFVLGLATMERFTSAHRQSLRGWVSLTLLLPPERAISGSRP